MTKEQEEQIKKLDEQGDKSPTIARKLGLMHEDVQKYLKTVFHHVDEQP